MDIHSENVQTALPRSDPDAARESATKEIIDLDYEIMDVEGQLLDVAATLAVQAGGITASRDYLLCPVRLSSFTPEKRLSLLQAHLSRLQKRLVRILHRSPGMMKRIKHCEKVWASQPATINPHLSPQLSGKPMHWHQIQCHQV